MNTREDLLKHLKNNTRVLQEARLERVFKEVDRADFVPDELAEEGYEDYPLPIGEGQTISQPTTVFFMLELLSVEEGDTVLDVGCGSGWTTALLAHIVGEDGYVYGVELVSALVELGKQNLGKYKNLNAQIRQAGGALGLPDKAPFDRILVSAAARDESVLVPLIEQLKAGGVLVAPVSDAVVRFEKHGDGKIKKKAFPGFAFVPLISD